MKKVYDAAIKDLMKIMIPGHGGHGPGAPGASAPGVQVHIHGAGAPGASDPAGDLPPQAPIPDLASEDSMDPNPADKHKREMKALHSKK